MATNVMTLLKFILNKNYKVKRFFLKILSGCLTYADVIKIGGMPTRKIKV